MSLFDVDVTIKASPKTPAALDVCQGLFGACALFLSGCNRASSFNLWGSFFPAWLVCATTGVLVTFAIAGGAG